MTIATSLAADPDAQRRAAGAGLRGVVLRQAFSSMLTPGPGAAKGLAHDSWRSLLAEAMANAAMAGISKSEPARLTNGAADGRLAMPGREVER